MAMQGHNPAIELAAGESSSTTSATATGGSINKTVITTTVREVDVEAESAPVLMGPKDVLADGDVQFKTMSWWHVGLLMIAETISLGILSLPWALATLGFVCGLVLLVGLGVVAGYAGYVIGQFKLAHPEVFCMADAGAVLFQNIAPKHNSEAWGRRIFGIGFVIFLVFIMAAHILTFGIMMNALTGHGACTIIFALVGTAVSFLCTMPRTLKSVSWLSIASFISIVAAVVVVMVSVGIEKRGSYVPFETVHKAKVASSVLAVMNIVLSYAGNVAFFGFISELRKPEDFPKALILLQGSAITLYAVVGALVYHFIGPSVPSPALSAARPLFRKIAWGLAIPTIVIAGVINGSVALKYIFVVLKGDLIKSTSRRAQIWWAGLNAVIWMSAWVLSQVIPNFQNLLGLVAALLGSWFTYGIPGWLWIHMNRKGWTGSWRKVLLMVVNVGVLVMGLVLCVLGTWSALKEIAESPGGNVFSCRDNSGS
ncbi:MAG: hypothetical protein M1828_007352 [Chrysothrix sp. TS-e1954]|nr:MAG: hypothetical protein M1828_007352 [Chrysothrix sp. TS-e1954]